MLSFSRHTSTLSPLGHIEARSRLRLAWTGAKATAKAVAATDKGQAKHALIFRERPGDRDLPKPRSNQVSAFDRGSSFPN